MAEYITMESALLGEKCHLVHHKSGLDIYVFPKKRTKYYALFATKYGAIDNCFKLKGQDDFVTVPDGIAHFLEHKMFENEDGVDTFERYSKFGASANAYTGNMKTAYLFSCTEHFSDNLEILLDFVTHPYFTPETVQKEQGIIGQEIRMYEDNPGWCQFINLMRAMYKANHMRIDVAGTCDTIAEITADILYKCYYTFYNLHNMALAVAGDLTVDEVLAVADKILKTAPEQEIVRNYTPGETKEVNMRRIEKKMQVSRPRFYIGIKDTDIPACPKERQKKQIAMNILYSMLFSDSGDLYNDLYTEGLIGRSFGGGYEICDYYAFGTVYAESDVPETIYDRFIAYVEDKKKNGLSEEDFLRCKRVQYAGTITAYEDTDSIANGVISSVFAGEELFSAPEAVNSVTFNDVVKYFNDSFKDEYYCMSVISPLDN